MIDLNLISGLYYNSAEDNSIAQFGGDGAHPGTVGHRMMADAIENVLLKNHLRNDHDHSYGSWITTTYPDCYDSEQQRVCTVCTAVELRIAEGSGHTPGDAVKENQTPAGYDQAVYCRHCGTELSRTWTDSYKPGDINSDGMLNNKDVIILMQYLAGWSVAVAEDAVDINRDGKLNNKDVVLLMQYLAGWDVKIPEN